MAKKFTKTADYDDTGVARCPKCGGTSFTGKRSLKGKVGMGLLAPKSRTRCNTCGWTAKAK